MFGLRRQEQGNDARGVLRRQLQWTVSGREAEWMRVIGGNDEGIHTFGLSHDGETSFVVLGRGHLRVLGGGSRSLSCSSHTLGW